MRSHCGVPARRFTLEYLSPMARSKCPRFRRRTTGAFSSMFEREICTAFTKLYKCIPLTDVCHVCFHNPVLRVSLARPNFFVTGAIIETRFQASLLTPYVFVMSPWLGRLDNHSPYVYDSK